MTFPKIKQQQKKSILAAELLLSVIGQRFAVGDKLPTERALAQEMDISRNTLREAIAALQVMGIIDVRHSQGNFIAAMPKTQDLRRSLETLFQPDATPFENVDSRIAFEPGIAYLAAERASEKDIQTIHSYLQTLIVSTQKGDRQAYAHADVLFHLAIAKATHNEIIIKTIDALIGVLRTPLWQAIKMGLDQKAIRTIRITEHENIFTSILEKNPGAAARHMRAHLVNSQARFVTDIEEHTP